MDAMCTGRRGWGDTRNGPGSYLVEVTANGPSRYTSGDVGMYVRNVSLYLLEVQWVWADWWWLERTYNDLHQMIPTYLCLKLLTRSTKSFNENSSRYLGTRYLVTRHLGTTHLGTRHLCTIHPGIPYVPRYLGIRHLGRLAKELKQLNLNGCLWSV